MTTMIHSSLVIKAMEAADVPLGGTLSVNEGGENDGTFRMDSDATDLTEVMSKLTGAVIELHALKTMVCPSNARRLNNVRDFLKGLSEPRSLLGWESMAHQFGGFVDDIEAVQSNLNFNS